MLAYLHRLSALCFYVLGTSFFVAYLLHRNLIGGPWPLWWLMVGDLPLIISALLYGGLSLYLSIETSSKKTLLGFCITLPLVALLGFLVVMNFWTPLS